MKRIYISNNVIRRLPRYLRKLDDLTAEGEVRISSSELGRQMNLTPSQIRQDFSCFGEFGQQGYGYNIASLREQINHILGGDRCYTAIQIGVGNLGHALIENFSDIDNGIKLIAAFDKKEETIGKQICGLNIQNGDFLNSFLLENHVDIVILAVPRETAQEIVDQIAGTGIRGIWNFSNIELFVGDSGVIVENIHFSDSIKCLTYYLAEEDDGV